MKFKFPLQKVLEYRKSIEDLAQRDFQLAQGDLLAAETQLSQMQESLRRSIEFAGEKALAGGFQAASLGQTHEFQTGQKVRIQRQEQKIQSLQKIVEEKREILRKAATDYKILEKMKEQKKAHFIAEFERQEQLQTDEMNVLRHRKEKDF